MKDINSEILYVWSDMDAERKAIIDQERALRREICDAMFGTRQGKFVSNRIVQADTEVLEVKATSKVNASVKDISTLSEIWGELNDVERACIKWSPTVNSKFFDLPKDSILHSLVETKPAMPSLEVKIKAKKNV